METYEKSRKAIASASGSGPEVTEVSKKEELNVKKEPTGQTGANTPTSLLTISNLDDVGDLQEKWVPSPQSCTHTAQDLKKDMVEAGGVCTHPMSHHARDASSLLPSSLTQPRTMQWGILGNIVPCKLHRQKRKPSPLPFIVDLYACLPEGCLGD